jgi:ATP-dependent Zn protease
MLFTATATPLGLGTVFTIITLVFALMLYTGFKRESWLYVLIGKYGFILMLLLSALQMNIDSQYATTQASLGFFLMFIISLLIFLIMIDLFFFILMVLPRKKKGNSWKLIMFGKV